MRTIPYTQSGFSDLKKQLEETISRRPDAVKELTRGRNMGDLSENGLYKAAKQELNDIDRQIRFLKNLVKYGKVSIPTNNLTVQIGHHVTIEKESITKTYLITGEYESDPREHKISFKSPIGHNLMGRKINDEIKINTPSGSIDYKIKLIK